MWEKEQREHYSNEFTLGKNMEQQLLLTYQNATMKIFMDSIGRLENQLLIFRGNF